VTTRLKKLNLRRISLVSEPACEDARVVLFKSKTPQLAYAEPTHPDQAVEIVRDQMDRAFSVYGVPPYDLPLPQALERLWQEPEHGQPLRAQYAAAKALLLKEGVQMPNMSDAADRMFKSAAGQALWQEFAKAASNDARDSVSAIGAAFDAAVAPVVEFLKSRGLTTAQAVDQTWRHSQDTYAVRIELMNASMRARNVYADLPASTIAKSIAEAHATAQKLADAAAAIVKKNANTSPVDALREAARSL
jgi:hypothetical protein